MIRHDIIEPQHREGVRDTLKKETEILSKLRHRSLPRVIENGTEESEIPYYVCSYHSGVTFASYRKDGRELKLAETVFVISELISVIVHVHSSGRTHCDLHANNILIGEDVFRDGIMLIDFGSGHRASDSSPDTDNRGNAGFKPPESLRVDRDTVNRSHHADAFRRADIVALGKLLTLMERVFVSKASPLVQDEYRRFCRELESDSFSGVKEVVDRASDVFDPIRCVNENADLFLLGNATRDNIVLPVTGNVSVGDPSLAVINTPEFQRLRQLKQLSFCDWHFPGGVHTRFEHALGVFALAWTASNHLAYDINFRKHYEPSDIRGFLLAALVHDIGHYPFAHAVEQYCSGRFSGENEGQSKEIARHETYTLAALEQDGTFKSVVCENWGESALAKCIRILKGHHGALSHLLDGPLDIDKMDYLARDAFHTGLSFGNTWNREILYSALTCAENGKEIFAHEEGLPAIEGFILSQDQMYGALYWHQAIRGVHTMFHAVIAHIVGKDINKLGELVTRLRKETCERDAVFNVIVPMLAESGLVKESDRAKLEEICKSIANPDCSHLCSVLHAYRHTDPTPSNAPLSVYRSIFTMNSGTGAERQVEWGNVRRIRQAFVKALQAREPDATEIDILIDVPFGKGSKRFAKIVTGIDAEAKRIDEITHLRNTAFENPVHFWSPIRVFVNPCFKGVLDHHQESIIKFAEEEFFHPSNS